MPSRRSLKHLRLNWEQLQGLSLERQPIMHKSNRVTQAFPVFKSSSLQGSNRGNRDTKWDSDADRPTIFTHEDPLPKKVQSDDMSASRLTLVSSSSPSASSQDVDSAIPPVTSRAETLGDTTKQQLDSSDSVFSLRDDGDDAPPEVVKISLKNEAIPKILDFCDSKNDASVAAAKIPAEEMVTLSVSPPSRVVEREASLASLSPKMQATTTQTSSVADQNEHRKSFSNVHYTNRRDPHDMTRSSRLRWYTSTLKDSCPCERHQKRMKAFVNWFLDKEDLKENKRLNRPPTHRRLSRFREAFPVDPNDLNPIEEKRGKCVKNVHSECSASWIAYHERHPECVALRRAAAALQQSTQLASQLKTSSNQKMQMMRSSSDFQVPTMQSQSSVITSEASRQLSLRSNSVASTINAEPAEVRAASISREPLVKIEANRASKRSTSSKFSAGPPQGKKEALRSQSSAPLWSIEPPVPVSAGWPTLPRPEPAPSFVPQNLVPSYTQAPQAPFIRLLLASDPQHISNVCFPPSLPSANCPIQGCGCPFRASMGVPTIPDVSQPPSFCTQPPTPSAVYAVQGWGYPSNASLGWPNVNAGVSSPSVYNLTPTPVDPHAHEASPSWGNNPSSYARSDNQFWQQKVEQGRPSGVHEHTTAGMDGQGGRKDEKPHTDSKLEKKRTEKAYVVREPEKGKLLIPDVKSSKIKRSISSPQIATPRLESKSPTRKSITATGERKSRIDAGGITATKDIIKEHHVKAAQQEPSLQLAQKEADKDKATHHNLQPESRIKNLSNVAEGKQPLKEIIFPAKKDIKKQLDKGAAQQKISLHLSQIEAEENHQDIDTDLKKSMSEVPQQGPISNELEREVISATQDTATKSAHARLSPTSQETRQPYSHEVNISINSGDKCGPQPVISITRGFDGNSGFNRISLADDLQKRVHKESEFCMGSFVPLTCGNVFRRTRSRCTFSGQQHF